MDICVECVMPLFRWQRWEIRVGILCPVVENPAFDIVSLEFSTANYCDLQCIQFFKRFQMILHKLNTIVFLPEIINNLVNLDLFVCSFQDLLLNRHELLRLLFGPMNRYVRTLKGFVKPGP